MIKIDKKQLEKMGACQDGIDFVVRNGLEGFPLDRIDEIEGDYYYFVEWLKTRPVCEYDDKGNKVKATYPDGLIYLYEYDAQGNRVKEISSGGYISVYAYDSAGKLIERIDEDGDAWTYEYNAAGEKIRSTAPYGNSWTYEYDSAGRKIKSIHSNGVNIINYGYDNEGRLILEGEGQDFWSCEYNAAGNMFKEAHAHEPPWLYEYDDRGNMIKSTRPSDEKSVVWSYDHHDDGTFTVTEDGEVLMTVPKF